MPSIPQDTRLYTFAEALRQAATQVFSQALSAPWIVDLPVEDPIESDQSDTLAFKLSSSGSLNGDAAVLLQTQNALLLAQKFLGEEVNASATLTNDHKEAVEELFRQVCGVAQTSLTGKFGEVKLQLIQSDVPAWQGTTVPLLASQGDDKFFLSLRIDKEFAEILSAPNQQPAAVEERPEEPQATKNLALLLGIDLSLVLRFGKSLLTLREILELPEGSVIEVDRQIHEPVDLLLGERIIAKGEVVVIEGNYGLRITDVPAFAIE
jgi:flagellar motor switch protein FliN/FliY